MFKVGDRVMRINLPQNKGIEIGDIGTITQILGSSGCEVKWDNGLTTGSFFKNLCTVIKTNKDGKGLLDKEW